MRIIFVIIAFSGCFRLFAQADQSHDKIFDQFLNLSELKTIGEYQYVLGKKLVQNLHNFDDYNAVALYVQDKGTFVGFVGDTTKFNYRKLDVYKQSKVRKLAKKHGYPIGTAIFQKTIIPGMDSLQMSLSWGKADTIREVKKGIVWIYKTKGTILLDKNKKAHKVYANKSEDD